MKEIIIVVSILAVAILFTYFPSVKAAESVWFIAVKDGKFSSQHISENKRMRNDGIHCANSQDREARRNNINKIDVRQM